MKDDKKKEHPESSIESPKKDAKTSKKNLSLPKDVDIEDIDIEDIGSLDLEDESVKQLISGIAIRKSISTSSPIPPPEVIEAYDKLDPIYSKTYLDQWVLTNETKRELDRQASKREDQKVSNEFELEKHRLNNNKQKDNNDYKQKRLTIILVFTFLFCLILLSTVSLLLGYEEIGIGTSIAGGLSWIGIVLRQIFIEKKK